MDVVQSVQVKMVGRWGTAVRLILSPSSLGRWPSVTPACRGSDSSFLGRLFQLLHALPPPSPFLFLPAEHVHPHSLHPTMQSKPITQLQYTADTLASRGSRPRTQRPTLSTLDPRPSKLHLNVDIRLPYHLYFPFLFGLGHRAIQLGGTY